jgi:hypothetical protein
MSTADEYRAKAVELKARAIAEENPLLRAQYENLALAYLRLVDQAEKNAATDIVYETPRQRSPVRQQQQQQQPQPQPQPEKKDG